jgi:hypothetical protein
MIRLMPDEKSNQPDERADRVDRWEFPPTDESGDVDLEQLRYNLSLTPAERLAQNDRWVRFFNALREGGRKFYEEQRQRRR